LLFYSVPLRDYLSRSLSGTAICSSIAFPCGTTCPDSCREPPFALLQRSPAGLPVPILIGNRHLLFYSVPLRDYLSRFLSGTAICSSTAFFPCGNPCPDTLPESTVVSSAAMLTETYRQLYLFSFILTVRVDKFD
jgi:hypothetical protein